MENGCFAEKVVCSAGSPSPEYSLKSLEIHSERAEKTAASTVLAILYCCFSYHNITIVYCYYYYY